MVVPGMDNMSSPTVDILGLCDDGTLWKTDPYSSYWIQIAGPDSHGDDLIRSKEENARLCSENFKLKKHLRQLQPPETP
jgi:hypothetical protein